MPKLAQHQSLRQVCHARRRIVTAAAAGQLTPRPQGEGAGRRRQLRLLLGQVVPAAGEFMEVALDGRGVGEAGGHQVPQCHPPPTVTPETLIRRRQRTAKKLGGGIGRRRLVDEAAEPALAEGDAEDEGEGIQLGREPSRAVEREV